MVQCLIRAGGAELCFDDPEEASAQAETGVVDGAEITQGWMIWPPIPYSYDTVNEIGGAAPSAPDDRHLLGTDDTARDVLARIIYGFRLSITFALVVTALSSAIGIAAGGGAGLFRRRVGPAVSARDRAVELCSVALHHHHHFQHGRDEFFGYWCS